MVARSAAEIVPSAVFEVRYVGNRGTNLFQSVNGNPRIDGLAAAFPNLIPAGLTPCPAAQAVVPQAVGRVNCNLGVVRNRTNTGYSTITACRPSSGPTNCGINLRSRADTRSARRLTTSPRFSRRWRRQYQRLCSEPNQLYRARARYVRAPLPAQLLRAVHGEPAFFRSQHALWATFWRMDSLGELLHYVRAAVHSIAVSLNCFSIPQSSGCLTPAAATIPPV